MNYYLRVEGVNLGNFVMDTNDLSTIRGGSLLLLDAMNLVETVIEKKLSSSPRPADTKPEELKADLQKLTEKKGLSKSEKNRKKNLRKRIRKAQAEQQDTTVAHTPTTITKGASWGLFQLNVEEKNALQIKKEVISALDKSEVYQHATFVVDLYKNNGIKHYQADRDRIQTLNRWQQMQSPSLAVPSPDKEVCDFDKVRPANPADYLENEEKHIARSVKSRRSYGRENKQKFYKRITTINDTFTNDLNQISSDKNRGILNGKIAFIYIDGNKFGSIQKKSKSPDEQRRFDLKVRTGRENVLIKILEKIRHRPDWIFADKAEKRIRLETLLWGGDEIIWVVPAWQGWWILKTFYQEAQEHITHPITNRPLKHAAGLVFCHHNAPVKRIEALARSLADTFAKIDRKKNLIAYQVLESFDHAGSNLSKFRQECLAGIGDSGDLLVAAEDMDEIESAIRVLKSDEIDFPRRKMYQILQEYRRGKGEHAKKYEKKLPAKSKEPLGTLKKIFGDRQAYWLHLMDLWNYIPASDKQEVDDNA